MIKAVLFDYAGVVTSGIQSRALTERLKDTLGVSQGEARRLLMIGWRDFSKGKISEYEFWQIIESESGIKLSPEKRKIWEIYDEHMKPLEEMLALINVLKNRGIKVGLLSNVIPPTKKDIEENGGYDQFDFKILSCDTGFAKPDKEIYLLALKKLSGIEPKDIVYVDDLERNLPPAKELGIQTIHAKNTQQVIRDIIALADK